ncbi:MAG: hypothetical protein ACFFC1_17705, partial [Promethearchaeota archaeon]
LNLCFEKSLRWLPPKNQNCELDCTLGVKISGHIPITKKMDYSNYNTLSHFSPDLVLETRNNKLEFELEVKV